MLSPVGSRKSHRSESKPLIQVRPVPVSPHPHFLKRVITPFQPVSKEHKRVLSERAEILNSFQQSLKLTEGKHGPSTSSEDFLGAVKTSFNDAHRFINPSLEKNFFRVNIMKNSRSLRNSPSQSRRVSVSQGDLGIKKLIIDRIYIDRFYQHPADSHATNKLPLPGSLNFDWKSIVSRRNGATESRKLSPDLNFERGLSFAEKKEFILSLMPREDEEQVFSVRPDPTLSQRGPRYHWSIKGVTGNRPESREGATLVVLDRKFYLFGGQSMMKRNDLKVMSPETWSWNLISTYYTPKGRIGHSLCAYKRVLVLYGGWSHYSSRLQLRRCYSKLNVVSIDGESKWQGYSGGGDMPKSRRDHSMASLGSSMLIFGGIDSHSHLLRSFRVLDLEEFRWKKPTFSSVLKPDRRCNASFTAVFHPALYGRWDFSIFNIPTPKIDQIVSWAGFYLFGGLSETNEAMNDLWRLKVGEAALEWGKVATTGISPSPRFSHTATHLTQMLVIVGGRNDSSTLGQEGSLLDLWSLHLDSMRWETIKLFGQIPEARWGHCALSFGSKLLILGGINYKSFLPADLYILETDPTYVQELIKQDEANVEKERLKFKNGRKKTRLEDE